MTPRRLALALIRETGPLTTGLLASGRVGAAIGAELGAMRMTEQIDALESIAVDSFKYLAVSRILAAGRLFAVGRRRGGRGALPRPRCRQGNIS